MRILLLLLSFVGLSAQATESHLNLLAATEPSATSVPASLPFEYQIIETEDGNAYYAYIQYNEVTDILKAKYTIGQPEPVVLSADEVTRFAYGQNQYVSLSYLGKFNTFYRIKHEGENCAVLAKKPTAAMLRLLAEANELVYFEKEAEQYGEQPVVYFQQQNVGHALDFYAPMQEEDKLYIEELVFLATPKRFDLFIAQTNKYTLFWQNYWQHQPNGRQVKRLLSPYAQQEYKLKEASFFAEENELDIRELDQLYKVLEKL